MTRWNVIVLFVVAEIWQIFFGAGTSLALGNPRVGEGASWVPNVLVYEGFTLLPVGFILCLWGVPLARRLAALCAAVSLGLAAVGSYGVSARPLEVSEFLVYFALLAVPGIVLLLCVVRMRRAPAVEPTS